MANIQYTDDPKRMRSTVRMLKKLAAEPKAKISDVAEETGINRSTTYTMMHDFCTLFEKTLDRDNFPEDLLTFYNPFSQRDDERLSKEEVLKLKELPKRIWPQKYPSKNQINQTSPIASKPRTQHKLTGVAATINM